MTAVVYTQTFGGRSEAGLYRQVRACGVAVVTHEHADPAAFPYAHVDVVPLRRGPLDFAWRALRRLHHGHGYLLPGGTQQQVIDCLCDRGATLIHAHGGPSALRIAPIAQRLECRLLVTFRGPDACGLPESDPVYRRALGPLFERAERVLASSRVVHERLLDLGCPRDGLELLPYGVPLRPLRPRRATNRESVKGIVVGALHPAAAVADLVDAVALARRMGAPLELEILGDGPDRAIVEQRIAHEGASEVVHLLGRRPRKEIVERLERADFFVHNGRPVHKDDEEGPPAMLLRAMAAGQCVVATRHGGVPDAVQHEVTGLLVESDDKPALAAALVEVAKDPGMRVALGAAARARMERDFNTDRAAQRLRELYG